MKIISTNIGKKKKVIYRGKDIYTGIFKYPVDAPIKLGQEDVENDQVIDRRYHGGIDKACYLFSADHYPAWKAKFPMLKWDWGMFGENLTVEGLDESEVFIGDVFKVGTAKVQVTQPRQPCFKFGIRMEDARAVKEFIKLNQSGVYVRVLEPGEVRKGDTFELIRSAEAQFSIKEIFFLLYNARENTDLIAEAVKLPELATSCKNDLKRMARNQDN
jgi:MOSC domain-containing protein YiiM